MYKNVKRKKRIQAFFLTTVRYLYANLKLVMLGSKLQVCFRLDYPMSVCRPFLDMEYMQVTVVLVCSAYLSSLCSTSSKEVNLRSFIVQANSMVLCLILVRF